MKKEFPEMIEIPDTMHNRVLFQELIVCLHELFCRMDVRKEREKEDRAFKKNGKD